MIPNFENKIRLTPCFLEETLRQGKNNIKKLNEVKFPKRKVSRVRI